MATNFDEYAEVIRKGNNLYSFSPLRAGQPTAEDVIKLVEIDDQEPRYPRVPGKVIYSICEDVQSEVETYASRWDMPKSRVAELMLKIAIGELERESALIFAEDVDQRELKLYQEAEILEVAENSK